jgi:hypothetical protein
MGSTPPLDRVKPPIILLAEWRRTWVPQRECEIVHIGELFSGAEEDF